ncbi:MAG: adenylate/guanylate cyclase domain-containing protein [Solirubrobacteraceae bacterium]|nr:adenylate/guanylate cyclase domain-containing protein [Solirubrobacteraceae bacterium]
MGAGRTGRGTGWIAALLVLVAAAVPALVIAVGGFASLRGEAADRLLHNRAASIDPPRDVVILAVDTRTVNDWGQSLPLPRSAYADAIERLNDAGVRAIGIDVQFTEDSPDATEDRLLREAVKRSRLDLVLATSEVASRPSPGVEADTNVLGGSRTEGGDAFLRNTRARAAHSSFPLGDDGKIRRAVRSIDGLSTFAHALATAAGGPGVPAAGMLLDPVVPADRLVRRSLDDLIPLTRDGYLDDSRIPRAELRGKVVLIGATAVGPSGDTDQKLVAGSSDRVYGVEVQAMATATALAGAPLSSGGGLSWALAALAALLSAAAALRRRLAEQVGIVVGLGVLIPLIAWIAVHRGLLLDPILPWLVLAFGGGAGVVQRALEERRARAAARATLSRFVPPAVVDDLLRDGSDGRIAPQSETATVMFCDLRGYTALTAGLARPEGLVDVLDAYLGTVSRVVYGHGGTVVSFQGDGVMAAFGVPVHDAGAAAQAVQAARELLTVALPQLRAELAATLGEEPASGLALGIGIATGPVFAGTVGPPTRREYAVVGPTTNLAARLQARTKDEPGPVLVDDATAAAVMGESRAAAHTGVRTPEGPLTPVGPRDIRGLTRSIDCWTLAG